MLTDTLHCRMVDFGLSVDTKNINKKTKQHIARGFTLAYRAPELYRNLKKKLPVATQKLTDVFSLGGIYADILHRIKSPYGVYTLVVKLYPRRFYTFTETLKFCDPSLCRGCVDECQPGIRNHAYHCS